MRNKEQVSSEVLEEVNSLIDQRQKILQEYEDHYKELIDTLQEEGKNMKDSIQEKGKEMQDKYSN